MEQKPDENQNKRFERKPNFDLRAKLSRDGRFWIIERIETWILPARYLAVIAENQSLGKDRTVPEEPHDKPKKKGKRNVDGNG